MKSITKHFSKALLMFIAVLVVAFFAHEIPVRANYDETVRVSTSKQLTAAINNDKVGTIILRTEADINITIKANKEAYKKILIIDAPRVHITNKAKFFYIIIQDAAGYIEKANDNMIMLDANCDFTVAAKKTVKELVIYDPISLEGSLGYDVKKGGKVEIITINYTKDEDVTYQFNGEINQGIIRYTDIFGTLHNNLYTFDKNGRLANVKDLIGDLGVDVTFTYNKNGDVASIVEITGRGEMVTTYHYDSKGYLADTYTECDDEFISKQVITRDSKGRVLNIDFYSGESEDENVPMGLITFEYDKKGRVVKYKAIGDSGYSVSYKYNSKGFVTQTKTEYNGTLMSIEEMKYNKKGDMTKKTTTNDLGEKYVIKYTYDELGELIKETVTDPYGKTSVTDYTDSVG